MSCEAETADILRRAGHRMTPQRLMIVRALRHAPGHMTAAQIAELVHRSDPAVDVSTVYRTLDVLRRMRLATATDVGQGDVVFEWAPDHPHHHLVCTSCEQIEQVDHSYFEELERRVRDERGFLPNFDHFAIFGLCRDCALEEDLDGHAP